MSEFWSSQLFSLKKKKLIRARTSTVKWYDQSPADNGRLLRSFQHEYERDKLTSVYKILRADPEVLEVCLTNT